MHTYLYISPAVHTETKTSCSLETRQGKAEGLAYAKLSKIYLLVD